MEKYLVKLPKTAPEPGNASPEPPAESPAEEVATDEGDDAESVASEGLPPGIRLKIPKKGLYVMQFGRRGKRYFKGGYDIQELVALRQAIEKTLDDANIPPTKVYKKRLRQSKHTGVSWNNSTSKWIGSVFNRLTGKNECTGCFPSTEHGEAQCAKAVEVLRARIDAEFHTRCVAERDKNEATKGLPLAPKVADAVPGIVYAHMCKKSGWTAYRAVKIGGKYKRACLQCNQEACYSVKGATAELCCTHGGGGAYNCPHGRPLSLCRTCNPNILKQARCCSKCGAYLCGKRKRSNGGNGICAACEEHIRAEAAENGSHPVDKSKKWEDYVLDKLIPKVVCAETGVPFAFEMRDDMRHMLGSNKRRRGECDTTKKRRPDLLYLVREPERGRIVAALKVGVDEHSHEGYDPECESGKIDDQFQSLQQLAAREGAASGAVARFDAQMIYCAFLKFNPNACDATPSIRLDDRIERLARVCSEFLNTPAHEFQQRSERGKANVPHVQCLFYHSVKGSPILDHFTLHANGAWDWKGNSNQLV